MDWTCNPFHHPEAPLLVLHISACMTCFSDVCNHSMYTTLLMLRPIVMLPFRDCGMVSEKHGFHLCTAYKTVVIEQRMITLHFLEQQQVVIGVLQFKEAMAITMPEISQA